MPKARRKTRTTRLGTQSLRSPQTNNPRRPTGNSSDDYPTHIPSSSTPLCPSCGPVWSGVWHKPYSEQPPTPCPLPIMDIINALLYGLVLGNERVDQSSDERGEGSSWRSILSWCSTIYEAAASVPCEEDDGGKWEVTSLHCFHTDTARAAVLGMPTGLQEAFLTAMRSATIHDLPDIIPITTYQSPVSRHLLRLSVNLPGSHRRGTDAGVPGREKVWQEIHCQCDSTGTSPAYCDQLYNPPSPGTNGYPG
ncbi:hypothetical protein K466DRAFT_563677 [Polyporus arcularius HHB13444]|uniref:Uncharacterized protein n=1 Tax=Polyporus arcularius HHB13444 TaxID=1314778 RepID=A0A5C3PMJ2_9APHY|nr:hypothetical protein K466DRAFT_563677 [Polyporus arcularius HHB13444]